MKKNLFFPALLVALALVIGLAGCGRPAAPVTLNVAAAASLTDALKEVNTAYTAQNDNVTVTPNFAGSGTLQKQIEQGAPADIFISAGASQMDALDKAGLLFEGTRHNLLQNSVVLIVPVDSQLGIAGFADLAKDAVKKLAMGDPKSVPAGTYGQQALDELGLAAAVKDKIVYAADVRAVLAYVESGDADAGIVYLTDARTSAKVKVVASAPDDVNAKVVYPVAVVKASANPDAARQYEEFLSGAAAQAIFEKYGFNPSK